MRITAEARAQLKNNTFTSCIIIDEETLQTMQQLSVKETEDFYSAISSCSSLKNIDLRISCLRVCPNKPLELLMQALAENINIGSIYVYKPYDSNELSVLKNLLKKTVDLLVRFLPQFNELYYVGMSSCSLSLCSEDLIFALINAFVKCKKLSTCFLAYNGLENVDLKVLQGIAKILVPRTELSMQIFSDSDKTEIEKLAKSDPERYKELARTQLMTDNRLSVGSIIPLSSSEYRDYFLGCINNCIKYKFHRPCSNVICEHTKVLLTHKLMEHKDVFPVVESIIQDLPSLADLELNYFLETLQLSPKQKESLILLMFCKGANISKELLEGIKLSPIPFVVPNLMILASVFREAASFKRKNRNAAAGIMKRELSRYVSSLSIDINFKLQIFILLQRYDGFSCPRIETYDVYGKLEKDNDLFKDLQAVFTISLLEQQYQQVAIALLKGLFSLAEAPPEFVERVLTKILTASESLMRIFALPFNKKVTKSMLPKIDKSISPEDLLFAFSISLANDNYIVARHILSYLRMYIPAYSAKKLGMPVNVTVCVFPYEKSTVLTKENSTEYFLSQIQSASQFLKN